MPLSFFHYDAAAACYHARHADALLIFIRHACCHAIICLSFATTLITLAQPPRLATRVAACLRCDDAPCDAAFQRRYASAIAAACYAARFVYALFDDARKSSACARRAALRALLPAPCCAYMPFRETRYRCLPRCLRRCRHELLRFLILHRHSSYSGHTTTIFIFAAHHLLHPPLSLLAMFIRLRLYRHRFIYRHQTTFTVT